MFKTHKWFLTIIILMLSVFVYTPTCYGNSAEPPSILIIVSNAPDDLEISIKSGNEYIKANKTDKVIETYYTFYSHEIRTASNYTLKVSTENSSFDVLLDQPTKLYNNIFTFDLKNKTLAPGKLFSRSAFLVSLRTTLTLLIEAMVFWLFGFREKKSWIVFLIINLITQGALNVWLNGSTPLESYVILTLLFGEILVFFIETMALLTLITEHNRIRTFSYVILANLLSLFAGGYIITILPV
ncbi:hypothetical protein [Phosphitispora fastidiosa]|uniref:hypothetical protein n=1 Tax=Phosphitispora fastidiosa TaxID=2837202 RepID=UPI001E53C493|nr:hypothetical protein [Phosphitispora fastidiosa]MBU7006064.1 hypothetical protein [Phosphitispora fastidiosa]